MQIKNVRPTNPPTPSESKKNLAGKFPWKNKYKSEPRGKTIPSKKAERAHTGEIKLQSLEVAQAGYALFEKRLAG